MVVDRFRHNYEGIGEKFTNPKSINRGKMDHNSRCKPFGNSLLASLFLSVKSIEEEIQSFGDRVDTARSWTLEQL